MRKVRFTEHLIIAAIKSVEAGRTDLPPRLDTTLS